MGFLTLVCLFFLAISLFAYFNGTSLQLPTLPWTGAQLTGSLIVLSLFGLLSIVLAGKGKLRGLMAAFAVYVAVQMINGLYLGPHRFDGWDEFRGSFAWVLSAIGAAGAAIRYSFVKLR